MLLETKNVSKRFFRGFRVGEASDAVDGLGEELRTRFTSEQV